MTSLHLTAAILLLLLLAAAASAPSSAYVLVEPTSPTWQPDSLNFNFAPATRLGSNSSLARAVYFVYNESDITLALQHVLKSASPPTRQRPRVEVRSGRHSYLSAASIVKGASVIDISNMTEARGVPFSGQCGGDRCTLVNVSAGSRLLPLYAALARSNLMFPGGTCPSVGASGYTLGGGIGLHARQMGLGAQNLMGARVATVDESGTVAWQGVSDESHPRFMKILRGAGNNLGVVSQMTLRVYPAPKTGSFVKMAFDASDCAAVWAAYERMLLSPDRTLCAVTPTLDIYGDSCGVLLSGGGVSLDELESLAQRFFLTEDIPSGQIVTMNSRPWIEALSLISCGIASTVSACLSRARRAPNPDVTGKYPPQFWAASSVFSNQALSVTNPSLELIQRVLDAVQQGEASVPSECNVSAVVIVDSLGCEVAAKAKQVQMAMADDVASTSIWHAQILAYWVKQPTGGGDAALCNMAVDDLVQNVFRAVDGAVLGFDRSYRNYPSRYLTLPLSRWYGANVAEVLQEVSKRDPLRIFDPFSILHV